MRIIVTKRSPDFAFAQATKRLAPKYQGSLCDPLSKLTQLTALKLGGAYQDIQDRELAFIRYSLPFVSFPVHAYVIGIG